MYYTSWSMYYSKVTALTNSTKTNECTIVHLDICTYIHTKEDHHHRGILLHPQSQIQPPSACSGGA